MPDHASSTSPAVQRQLDRLWARSPGADILGLDRITELLARIGDPHLRLPPVLHVAGTNGKGSTCAILRAAIEGAGLACHVYTSPHLVRFNERIRLAGTLIDDAALAPLLEEVLNRGEDIGASFFEVTTAAAFLAFARQPADACIIEVGLGGRLDATNVLPAPAACGIAQLGIDHEAFLGSDAVGIAGEKAGVTKPGAPLVTLAYPPEIAARIAEVAMESPLIIEGRDWTIQGTRYHDSMGELTLAASTLPGAHQAANAGLAIAMLRHQRAIRVPDTALAAAPSNAQWPARLQKLAPGPLTRLLPTADIYLDGGHNPSAAAAIAAFLATEARGRPIHLILGMLANKDVGGLLAPIAPLAESLHAVPVPGHEYHAPEVIAATARTHGLNATSNADIPTALAQIPHTDGHKLVLILGSLYLAGTVLTANDQPPD